MKILFLIFLTITTWITVLHGQNFSDELISPDLGTVQLHRKDWALSFPIIQLNSDQRLHLSFDELGSGIKNYYYSITLCDADWNDSRLMTSEYQTGVPVNPILDYSYSFNTTFAYVHYGLTFPNQDVGFKTSGNYVIRVFENNNEKNPILIKKFIDRKSVV